MDSSLNSVPFLSYLTKLADHRHALTRAKLALFLQGSPHYDLEAIHSRLEALDSKNLFPLETAIVYGRVSPDLEKWPGAYQEYSCLSVDWESRWSSFPPCPFFEGLYDSRSLLHAWR